MGIAEAGSEVELPVALAGPGEYTGKQAAVSSRQLSHQTHVNTKQNPTSQRIFYRCRSVIVTTSRAASPSLAGSANSLDYPRNLNGICPCLLVYHSTAATIFPFEWEDDSDYW